MTNPTNWPNPERPGVPMFPERDGWHWLSNRPNDAPFPAEWSHEDYCDAETEWFWDMGEEREDAYEMKELYYHGPCPLPDMGDKASCIALNNICTLTERARKNIAVASGARKIAKTIFPILADIDRQVDAARNTSPTLTPHANKRATGGGSGSGVQGSVKAPTKQQAWILNILVVCPALTKSAT